jgi:hypothetical protein
MSSDRSYERRQRAAETFAKQMADWRIRASVLGMTQRWLDLAEPGGQDFSDRASRLLAIQMHIGKELPAHYPLPRDQPHQLFTLLMQLDGKEGDEHRDN